MIEIEKKRPRVLFVTFSGSKMNFVSTRLDTAELSGDPIEVYVSLTRVRELFAEKGIETDLRITED